eukprot:TRINITY_DN62763_c0_g1_i1.p1 TRINITY_DN62763_c0_g1~~TRINITY_DN62763_c0_g1_i1.p1  ORF type:complete len:386 (-),score=41.98 TRINITY_DN62763_c0_g1_i1:247-1404(-)
MITETTRASLGTTTENTLHGRGRRFIVRLLRYLTSASLLCYTSAGYLDEPQNALAAVSFYVSRFPALRNDALRRCLQALAALKTLSPAVAVEVMLVTNKRVHAVSNWVSSQIIVEKPRCGARLENRMCLPWAALRAIVERSGGDRFKGCKNGNVSSRTAPSFDFYFYLEGDIELPRSSFDFWRKHVDAVHARGFLLMPYRIQRHRVLSDYFSEGCGHCMSEVRPMWAASMAAELPLVDFGNATTPWQEATRQALFHMDHVYFLQSNPYAGSWLMTCQQFHIYVKRRRWDFDRVAVINTKGSAAVGRPLLSGDCPTPKMPYQIREMAATGLLCDRSYGVSAALSHLNVSVFHLLAMSEEVTHEPLENLRVRARRCAASPGIACNTF